MPPPVADNTGNAVEVVSLTTASAGDLVLVDFVRRGGSKRMLGMWKQTAIDLFLTINHAASQFGLWDKDFNLLPPENSQRITYEEIWRAANQLMQRDHAAAEAAATERSRAAYAEGDIFNSDMWERVAQAVAKLTEPKPKGPNALN